MPAQIPKLISFNAWSRLYGAVSSDRNRLILSLLYGTGCRVGELVTSRVEDVDLSEMVLHLQADRTKTRRYRSVVVPAEIIPQLQSWMKRLPEDQNWLFPGQKRGQHITARRVRQIVNKAAEKANIQRVYAHDKNGRPLNVVSPHTLRHAHAVTALDAGVPLNDLQAQLGHANLATTSVYLTAGLEHRKRAYKGVRFGELIK
ncbi:MAG: tyrosine-type recombinase/integrase [Methanotrichaceae archaeon]